MTDRSVFNSSTLGVVTGDIYMDQIAGHIGKLYDGLPLIPTSITNSGNDYTLTIDPVLDDDVKNGMSFLITPNVTNTGPVRMRADATLPYYDVLDASGAALEADAFDPTVCFFVAFVSGGFRLLSIVPQTQVGAVLYSWEYTSSGVWNKPDDLNENALALIEVWGAGGGGAASSQRAGGGGGGYNRRLVLASELAATEAVTVGAGGSAGAAGGQSAFGTHVVAYGGGAGDNTAPNPTTMRSGGGGGGGGQISTGQSGTNLAGGAAGTPSPNAGNGGWSYGSDVDGKDGISGGGGGAGAAYNTLSAGKGGKSLYGGGGGAGGNQVGSLAGTGGTSVFGGNGGDTNVPGSIPAGGGGAGAAGAAGMVRIKIIT